MVWTFLGALTLATGTVFERFVLAKKRVSINQYQAGQFLALVLVAIPFLPFFWRVGAEAYTLKNVLIFASVIILSMFANYFTFYSTKNQRLGIIQSAKMTESLWTIVLAFLFSFIFGTVLYERNYSVLIPAGIAAIALFWSQTKKEQLKFNKYYLAALAGSFFFAAEMVVSRLILDFYNPIVFYFFRCAAILVLTIVILRPQFNGDLDKKTILQILGTGVIWFAYRIIVYLGYISLGIVETTLTIMLGPVLVYLFAWKFLKDKLNWKQLVTAGIILACVGYATFSWTSLN